jgi:hypothetical protein
MMKYGIHDIRVMNAGDIRALVPPSRLAGASIWEKRDRAC